MKKTILLLILVLLSSLAACQSVNQVITYTDDDPFVIEMVNEDLKILQLTDLHLTYGIDAYDRKTFAGIEKLVSSEEWDLVVISGDIALSISTPSLFAKLIKVMEKLETPWTFVFGNHETDNCEYVDLLNKIEETEYLYFKVGPELDAGGVGNFRIQFTKDDIPFYTLYLMDSHAEREVYTEEEGEYDYIRTSQVAWYESHVSEDLTDSIMYMHIPLRQFIDPDSYEGIFDEDKVYAQGVDTGLFTEIVDYGRTKGVFVGHDHLNNFSFELDGVLLAYGQVTGYSGYGNLNRGGRVVEISETGIMTSYILLESEVIS
ncbi:metallophosphoesterase [Mycoplasmatota bacterium WC30]